MKKPVYKSNMLLIITLLFVSFTISAQEVTKEFHKEYTAGAKTTLDISNRYGDIVIQSWDKNQVVIDVKVTVELPNKEKAEKLLSYIDVRFSEGENLIAAKTIIDDKFNFSGWSSSSKNFRIDYTINMPVEAALVLANIYGNTDLNELHGLVDLNIRYGNLAAGNLTRGNVKPLSKLNIAYGKGTIDETGWLDLTIRYCGNMNIAKSQAILLDSKYSKVYLGEISSIVGESKYDKITITSVNNMVLENGYTDVTIENLAKKLNYEGSYGSFTVESVTAGFESINVDTRYMSVRLGIPESESYNLDAKVSYGGLQYNEDNFNVLRRIIENNSKEVKGISGKQESPTASIKVVASYGSVKLY